MVVTYYVKLFHMGSDRHNGILMSLLLLVAETTEHYTESFLYEQELSNLVKEKTCFKNIQNPSCIDLLLTNNSYAFQQTTTVHSGLSDCHKLILTVLKTSIPKGSPRQITYRDHKKFNFLKFNSDLKNALTKGNIDSCTKFDEKF